MRDQSEGTMTGNGQLTVPPGFRFHPTDEELLHYYLRKKVSYEAIDLDVIREVDLNKLEPWDLKEKCRVGSGQQSEWYFFSHKDKKYPTGTRTNRATMAGFWKATGRDKPIHLPEYSKKIGMRKTLVFYTGRAPHGQKTDWIMHEYRLEDQNNEQIQEEGWVVCRVFKKKNYNRPFRPDSSSPENFNYQKASTSPGRLILETTKDNQIPAASTDYSFGASLHLPQLLIPDSVVAAPSFGSSISLNAVVGSAGYPQFCRSSQWERLGDWSLLDKLLASSSNNGVDQNKWSKGVGLSFHNVGDDVRGSTQNLLFQYVGAGTASRSTETEVFKFHKQS